MTKTRYPMVIRAFLPHVLLALLWSGSLESLRSEDASTGLPQTIHFPSPGSRYLDSPPFRLSAVASSGLPVTYEVVAGGEVVDLAGDLVTFTGIPGSVTVRASQDGDGIYAPAEDALTTFAASSGHAWVTIRQGNSGAAALRADGTAWVWGWE